MKNIDIFGATKSFSVCNCLILSLGATKMYAGAIKMFYAGATKKSLTRVRRARVGAGVYSCAAKNYLVWFIQLKTAWYDLFTDPTPDPSP